MKKILSLFALLFALTVSSCSESSTGEEDQDIEVLPTGEIELSIDRSRIVNTGADQATLTLTCEGVDVTEYAKFYCVGAGVAMSSNTFTSTENGTYEFYANYNNTNSDKVSLLVGSVVAEYPADTDASNTLFESKMLMLQFTGAECTYCQYMIGAIEMLAEDSYTMGKYEHVAVHSYYGYGADDLYSSISAILSQAMSVAYYPGVMFNMDTNTLTYNAGYEAELNFYSLSNVIEENYDSTPSVGICAATSIEDGVLSANVQLKAAEAGKYRVGMFMVENGLYGYQSGYTSDIEHVNTLRASSDRPSTYDFSGMLVGEIEAGEYGSTILDMTIDQTAWDMNNCHLVIYATTMDDNGNNIVQNVVRCQVEGEVAYQYAN